MKPISKPLRVGSYNTVKVRTLRKIGYTLYQYLEGATVSNAQWTSYYNVIISVEPTVKALTQT